MPKHTAIEEHRKQTKNLALALNKNDVYKWLLEEGYFPESYVLPPCFKVLETPKTRKQYYPVKKKRGKNDANCDEYSPLLFESVRVHLPKSEFIDRTFRIIHPHIHNDIAYHISENWRTIVEALLPSNSIVTTYSFPVPISKNAPGRVGNLRSGRMIYEFIDMTDDDLASIAYRYTHLVRADIKNFYPSIYTHAIAWVLHGKEEAQKDRRNYSLFGNILDKLFQSSNGGRTNGLPIGPVVSDIAAEIVAAAIDSELTKRVDGIDCTITRFKDDYRILVKSENDARKVIKALQASLQVYNLEISDEKTSITQLPQGLFREWVSRYHAIHPVTLKTYSWKQFRELYLGVVEINYAHPSTGVIDRFLADIISNHSHLKLTLEERNLERTISMLFMLGSLRVKAFPKIMAILELVLRSQLGKAHENSILTYLEEFLLRISSEEAHNKYLISWLLYFLVSNGLYEKLRLKPEFKDPITKSIASNRAVLFLNVSDFKLFLGCKSAGRKITMLEHLNVFSPPSVDC